MHPGLIDVVLGHMDAVLDGHVNVEVHVSGMYIPPACTLRWCLAYRHRTVPLPLALVSERWVAAPGSTWGPLPATSTQHGKEHCFCELTLAFDSILATFFLAFPVVLAWHCVFRARASFDATGKSGGWHTGCKPRVGIVFVVLSCGISAARTRIVVVCLLLGILLRILTSQSGA